jgi:hypothetical protein
MFQVAEIVRGDHDDVIGNVTIVDCRYPYEYEGGHIRVRILQQIYVFKNPKIIYQQLSIFNHLKKLKC